MIVRQISTLLLSCLMPFASAAQDMGAGSNTFGDWSGGYVGLQFGAIGADQTANNVADTGVVARSWPADPQGAQGGLYLGYNWQHGPALVYGVEGEVNWSGADGSAVQSRTLINAGGAVTGTITEVIDTRILATAALRGRVGYTMDNTLFYAAAGLAWIEHDGVYDIQVNSLGTSRPFSGTELGWTVGIGVEHAFAARWVGRIDYRYSDFGQVDYLQLGPTNTLTGDLATHEIRAGIAMRF